MRRSVLLVVVASPEGAAARVLGCGPPLLRCGAAGVARSRQPRRSPLATLGPRGAALRVCAVVGPPPRLAAAPVRGGPRRPATGRADQVRRKEHHHAGRPRSRVPTHRKDASRPCDAADMANAKASRNVSVAEVRAGPATADGPRLRHRDWAHLAV